MAFETREQVLEKVVLQDKPLCPHCGKQMSLWEVPDINAFDGLGWGTPFLFVCFNNDCPVYVDGWKNMEENYGRKVSYRCLCYPGTENFEFMTVYSSQGGGAQIIDDEAAAKIISLKERTRKGMDILEGGSVSGNHETVVKMLIDATEPEAVRVRAAEIIANIGVPENIDALNNHPFGSSEIRRKAKAAVEKIHTRHYTRECPFCAEIIKKQAKICKHCRSEIP